MLTRDWINTWESKLISRCKIPFEIASSRPFFKAKNSHRLLDELWKPCENPRIHSPLKFLKTSPAPPCRLWIEKEPSILSLTWDSLGRVPFNVISNCSCRGYFMKVFEIYKLRSYFKYMMNTWCILASLLKDIPISSFQKKPAAKGKQGTLWYI